MTGRLIVSRRAGSLRPLDMLVSGRTLSELVELAEKYAAWEIGARVELVTSDGERLDLVRA